jgi:hypothetical protein
MSRIIHKVVMGSLEYLFPEVIKSPKVYTNQVIIKFAVRFQLSNN